MDSICFWTQHLRRFLRKLISGYKLWMLFSDTLKINIRVVFPRTQPSFTPATQAYLALNKNNISPNWLLIDKNRNQYINHNIT